MQQEYGNEKIIQSKKTREVNIRMNFYNVYYIKKYNIKKNKELRKSTLLQSPITSLP